MSIIESGLDHDERALDDLIGKCGEAGRDIRGSAVNKTETSYFRKETLGIKGSQLDRHFGPMLDRFGFRFIPAALLPPYDNGGMHTEGEWRHPYLSMGFTETDLLTIHKNSPQSWFEWFQHELDRRRGILRKKRLASMGIVLPR